MRTAYHFRGADGNAPKGRLTRGPPSFLEMPAMARRRSLRRRLFVDFAVIDIAHGDRPSPQRAGTTPREFQRHAAVQRGVDRLEIGFTDIRRHTRRCEGQTWRPDQVAGSFETEAPPHRHALLGP